MEKELPQPANLSEEIKGLVQFLGRFPETHTVSPQYFQREEYWIGMVKSLRQAAERRELSWDQYDSLIGNLAAAKEWLSNHDPLTGLFNRRFFEEELEIKMGESKRYGFPLTLVFIDVDNLKTLNDERGHPVADQFLQEFGRIIQDKKRASDTAARIGGDEFAIIAPHTSQNKTKNLMKRIQKTIQSFIKKSPPFEGLSKPLGITFAQEEWDGKQTPEIWKEKIDEKLYDLKKQKHG